MSARSASAGVANVIPPPESPWLLAMLLPRVGLRSAPGRRKPAGGQTEAPRSWIMAQCSSGSDFILAALPVYFLLKSLVMGTKTGSQAVANFKQQVDYAVWVILFFIGCAVVYGIAKLVFNIH